MVGRHTFQIDKLCHIAYRRTITYLENSRTFVKHSDINHVLGSKHHTKYPKEVQFSLVEHDPNNSPTKFKDY